MDDFDQELFPETQLDGTSDEQSANAVSTPNLTSSNAPSDIPSPSTTGASLDPVAPQPLPTNAVSTPDLTSSNAPSNISSPSTTSASLDPVTTQPLPTNAVSTPDLTSSNSLSNISSPSTTSASLDPVAPQSLPTNAEQPVDAQKAAIQLPRTTDGEQQAQAQEIAELRQALAFVVQQGKLPR